MFRYVELRNDGVNGSKTGIDAEYCPLSQSNNMLTKENDKTHRSPALFPYLIACSRRGRFARMWTLSNPDTIEQKSTCARL